MKTLAELKAEEQAVIQLNKAKEAEKQAAAEKRKAEWLRHGMYKFVDDKLVELETKLNKDIAENKGILPKHFYFQMAYSFMPKEAELLIEKLKTLGYSATAKLNSGRWRPCDECHEEDYEETTIYIDF